MIFPAILTSIYGWDFPWRTVSHNQMVAGMVFGHQSFAGIWIQKDHSFTQKKIGIPVVPECPTEFTTKLTKPSNF